jgi:hypothetical protein
VSAGNVVSFVRRHATLPRLRAEIVAQAPRQKTSHREPPLIIVDVYFTLALAALSIVWLGQVALRIYRAMVAGQ